MAKDIIKLSNLEEPYSRQEMFFHFIAGTGRITFDQLPQPYSRVELLLIYIVN